MDGSLRWLISAVSGAEPEGCPLSPQSLPVELLWRSLGSAVQWRLSSGAGPPVSAALCSGASAVVQGLQSGNHHHPWLLSCCGVTQSTQKVDFSSHFSLPGGCVVSIIRILSTHPTSSPLRPMPRCSRFGQRKAWAEEGEDQGMTSGCSSWLSQASPQLARF